MKKIISFLLLICLSFIYINQVNAVTSKFSCEDPNNCILMCQYEETIYKSDRVFGEEKSKEDPFSEFVEIYYYLDKDEYEIIWSYKSFNNLFGTLDKTKNVRGSLDAMPNTVHGVLQKGKCPADVSIDLSTWGNAGFAEICIGYDTATCIMADDANEDSSTRFSSYKLPAQAGGGLDTYLVKQSSTKTYDLTSDVKEYVKSEFEKYASENFVVDETKPYNENPVCVKNYDEEKQNMLNYVEQKVNEKYFSGKKMPSWINSTNIYEPVIDYFVKGDGLSLMKRCQMLAANDSSLSQEEKDQIIGELEEKFNIFYGELYDHFENYFNFDFADDFSGPESCLGFLGSKSNYTSPAFYLDLVLKIMRYAAIILTIVLSTVDFLKAVVSQDKDLLKKASINSVKRLVLTIVLFLFPVILDFILGLLGAYNSCINEVF